MKQYIKLLLIGVLFVMIVCCSKGSKTIEKQQDSKGNSMRCGGYKLVVWDENKLTGKF